MCQIIIIIIIFYCCTVHVVMIISFIPTHAHFYTLYKTRPYMFWSIYIWSSSGCSWAVLCAVTKLNSMDVRSLCSCIVCCRMSLSSVVFVCVCVCVPGVPVLVRSGHGDSMTRLHQDRNSRHTPTHTHTTDDNYIRPHTIQEHNERTSTEFNLVTAQSTAHEPPEDGRKYMDRNM
jgi:hypothetical protein